MTHDTVSNVQFFQVRYCVQISQVLVIQSVSRIHPKPHRMRVRGRCDESI